MEVKKRQVSKVDKRRGASPPLPDILKPIKKRKIKVVLKEPLPEPKQQPPNQDDVEAEEETAKDAGVSTFHPWSDPKLGVVVLKKHMVLGEDGTQVESKVIASRLFEALLEHEEGMIIEHEVRSSFLTSPTPSQGRMSFTGPVGGTGAKAAAALSKAAEEVKAARRSSCSRGIRIG